MNNKLINTDIKNSQNLEELVPPVTEKKEENLSFKDNLNSNSYQIMNFVDKLFINWDNIFEYFVYNRFIYKYDTSEFKIDITKSIEKFRSSYSRGNVDNLVKDYGELIKKECNIYKLDWRLILSIIRQESYFDPNAVSHAGALGLMQIMPGTGSSLQNILQLEDTRSPQNNLIAGIYFFATLVADFEFTGDDKYQFALCSYNAGLGRTIDAMSITYYLNQDYKKWENVKENLRHLSSKSDSLHKLIWSQSKRPLYGMLENWQEPYTYVTNVMFYFEEYKKLFDSNLIESKPKKKNNKSKSKRGK
ncbi:MAG TPA: transglycosylase SLT domain-containing protein [Ignavibacteria bacterium]